MLEVEIEEMLGRRGTTFAFRHEGKKAFCFITASRDAIPRLARGMRLVIEGRWSPAGQLIFEAHAITLIAGA